MELKDILWIEMIERIASEDLTEYNEAEFDEFMRQDRYCYKEYQFMNKMKLARL